MGLAVELYFDSDTETTLRQVRAALTKGSTPHLLDTLGDRPHLSLAVFEQEEGAGDLLLLVEAFAVTVAPFEIGFSAIGAFPTDEIGSIFVSPPYDHSTFIQHCGKKRAKGIILRHPGPNLNLKGLAFIL
jgi:hypothetical protein